MNPRRAARLLDEAIHHRQPQARALAFFLGGEERLHDFVLNTCVDAVAVIRDRNAHVTALGQPITLGTDIARYLDVAGLDGYRWVRTPAQSILGIG